MMRISTYDIRQTYLLLLVTAACDRITRDKEITIDISPFATAIRDTTSREWTSVLTIKAMFSFSPKCHPGLSLLFIEQLNKIVKQGQNNLWHLDRNNLIV